MPYRLLYHRDVKTKDLPRIDARVQQRIRIAIESRVQIAPDVYGLPLRKTLKGYWKIRIGDYRVVYKVDGYSILIYCICHRRDVYQVATAREKAKE
ncbi:type II toxin-antitoxin system RelE family toxin [Desulfonatronum parangueonense]